MLFDVRGDVEWHLALMAGVTPFSSMGHVDAVLVSNRCFRLESFYEFPVYFAYKTSAFFRFWCVH